MKMTKSSNKDSSLLFLEGMNMKESRMQRNCERCRLRKSQETYLGIVFDYRTCPFVCVENKLYDNLKRKKKEMRLAY